MGFANPVAPKDILELVKCDCITGCRGSRCRCFKNKLLCTGTCQCQSCENREKESLFVVSDEEDEKEKMKAMFKAFVFWYTLLISRTMWGDGDVPKCVVYFCHPISRIFGPCVERHGHVPDFWVIFEIYNHKIQIKNLHKLQTREYYG